MNHMTIKEYKKFSDKRIPPSDWGIKLIKAFVSGGIICIIGQGISDFISSYGFQKDAVSSFTSIILIFLGGFLTALDIYDSIAKFAGAGTIVPITGFANAVVSPAIEFKSEGMVLGMSAKMFVIAGPVLVYGITTSIICGLFLLIFGG